MHRNHGKQSRSKFYRLKYKYLKLKYRYLHAMILYEADIIYREKKKDVTLQDIFSFLIT